MDPHKNGNDNVMAPVADLFNYNPEKIKTNWTFSKKDDQFKVIATDNIKKGEEIFVDYGDYDNKHFFLN